MSNGDAAFLAKRGWRQRKVEEVHRKLSGVNGIDKIDIDMSTFKVRILLKEGVTTDEGAILRIVREGDMILHKISSTSSRTPQSKGGMRKCHVIGLL